MVGYTAPYTFLKGHCHGYLHQTEIGLCGADDPVGHRRGVLPGHQQHGGPAPRQYGYPSLGYITIPKIDVNLPIYEGTSDDVLLKGVGHLEGSSYPLGGESTHSVLTGHRGLAEAVLFTDLDKLQEGDKFYLHIMDEVLAYQVDQVKVVLPEETDDLTIVQGQDYCTLVTCTPYAINTHRMLVRGIRVPYNGEEETGDTPQVVQYQALHTGTVVKRIVDAWPWISVTGSVIIGGEALLLLLLLHRCKKREEDD